MIIRQIIVECDNCGKQVMAGSLDVSQALLRVLRMGWVATDLIQLCEECTETRAESSTNTREGRRL